MLWISSFLRAASAAVTYESDLAQQYITQATETVAKSYEDNHNGKDGEKISARSCLCSFPRTQELILRPHSVPRAGGRGQCSAFVKRGRRPMQQICASGWFVSVPEEWASPPARVTIPSPTLSQLLTSARWFCPSSPHPFQLNGPAASIALGEDLSAPQLIPQHTK